VAQEQVGLAYAGWDRLLTRVALPAWRMGRWPARSPRKARGASSVCGPVAWTKVPGPEGDPAGGCGGVCGRA
ncbi:hypothetical protein, partial [Streptomyces sp. NPDC006996]|uniref:hypothetical protein n=1 Tax=Streptomyces sp. NPDC006996 TaxID=3156908 RepID=UPI003405EBE7